MRLTDPEKPSLSIRRSYTSIKHCIRQRSWKITGIDILESGIVHTKVSI